MIQSIVPTKIIEKDFKRLPLIDPVSKLRPKPIRHTVLIVGDATGVWEDVGRFEGMGIEHDTMLINHVALAYPLPYQHFLAGDSHMADMQRVAKKIPKKVIKHCWNPNSYGFDVRWIRQAKAAGWCGTTANLAAKVAICLGYLKIVFAGIPMDNSGHWYDEYLPENDVKRQSDHRHHLWKWSELGCRPQSRLMRSMSGNTKDLFGEPTVGWLLDIPIPLNGGENGRYSGGKICSIFG